MVLGCQPISWSIAPFASVLTLDLPIVARTLTASGGEGTRAGLTSDP